MVEVCLDKRKYWVLDQTKPNLTRGCVASRATGKQQARTSSISGTGHLHRPTRVGLSLTASSSRYFNSDPLTLPPPAKGRPDPGQVQVQVQVPPAQVSTKHEPSREAMEANFLESRPPRSETHTPHLEVRALAGLGWLALRLLLLSYTKIIISRP